MGYDSSAMLTEILQFVSGLALLVVGAEVLVRGASRLAAAAGLSPVVIGLTVVAYGTGAPELAVGIKSAAVGQAELALGNVVGSNICNVLLTLGVTATMLPLVIARNFIRTDLLLMIGVSILPLLLALDGEISRVEGGFLVAGMIVFTVVRIRIGLGKSHRKDGPKGEKSADEPGGQKRSRWSADVGMVIGGLILLLLGGNLLVDGAVGFAERLGVPKLIVGLTVVAIGTSMPEVATSIIATYRGAHGIAVGNVVGSNIFNILAVLGTSSLVAPDGMAVPESFLKFDLIVMLVVAVVCLPIFFTGRMISRWEGILLLGYYGAYTTYLVLYALDHWVLSTYNRVMVGVIIPLTVLIITVEVVRNVRGGRRQAG